MKYVRIGSSGLYSTQIIYGTALTIGTEILSQDKANELIKVAWDNGIRAFDTSNNYGNGMAEKLLGKALSFYDRQSYIISTKGSWQIGEGQYMSGLSRKHILFAIEKSLHNLNLEYIDIYYAHRYDTNVSMREIVFLFNELIRNGKIRYWATSEWPESALTECFDLCDKYNLERPIGDQFIYSFLVRKAENNGVIEFCVNNGYGMLGFSPLAQGILTGKYIEEIPENSRIAKSESLNYDKTKNFMIGNEHLVHQFVLICRKYNIKPVHAAVRWVIRHGVIPVIGASKSEQIIDNIKSLEINIPNDFWSELEEINKL